LGKLALGGIALIVAVQFAAFGGAEVSGAVLEQIVRRNEARVVPEELVAVGESALLIWIFFAGLVDEANSLKMAGDVVIGEESL
jgi:hypothetical protein